MADHIRKTYGRLEVLINNAGIHMGRPALEITATEMRKTFETNVFWLVTMINITPSRAVIAQDVRDLQA